MRCADAARTGYARVAAVVGAFAHAFTDPETALGLYLAAFVCDELVRALCALGCSCAALLRWRGALMRRGVARRAGRPLRAQVQPVHHFRRRVGHGH